MPRFVPCRTSHLAHELALWFEPDGQAGFWELTRVVENHHHYGSVDARLVEALDALFDPDVETVPPATAAGASLPRLQERLEGLLTRANFSGAPADVLLSRADREVLARLKLDPDLAALEEIAIFHRGRGQKAVTIRPVRKFFRLEEHEVATYRRVAVLVRTKSEPHVTLKLFKDVPCQDLELLVAATVRVNMRVLDKLKLSGSSGAAVVSAWKLLRALYTYAPGVAKLLAVPFQALLLPVAVLITGIYGSKTLLDYSKIRASYITGALAEHLYAITMASNSAVLARLASMSGEEDTKEVLLAYAVLARLSLAAHRRRSRRPRRGPHLGPLPHAGALRRAGRAAQARRAGDLRARRDGESARRAARRGAAQPDRAWDDVYAAPSQGTRRLTARRVDKPVA